jgi:hypothetical protein
MLVCVSNTSQRDELEIGKYYEVFKHESGPKFAWVKIIDESNSVGWRTIQCYSADFSSKSSWRNQQIDKILD